LDSLLINRKEFLSADFFKVEISASDAARANSYCSAVRSFSPAPFCDSSRRIRANHARVFSFKPDKILWIRSDNGWTLASHLIFMSVTRVESVEYKNPHSIIVVRQDDGTAYTVDWMPLDGLTRNRILESAKGALTGSRELRGYLPDTREVNPRTRLSLRIDNSDRRPNVAALP
jgi:hypothetical protein